MSQWRTGKYDVLIRESHLDSFGHVNNAVYLQLFEEARWQMITDGGYGYDRVHETKVGPTILEINIQFIREIKLRQQITINTWMLNHSEKIDIIRQEMVDQENRVCCRADFKIAMFDLKQRKIVRPPADWLIALGKIED